MCLSPIFLKRPEKMNGGDTVPCSQCYVCKKKHYNNWLFRLTKQYEICTSAWFITLTYNNENLKELNKRDLQLFLKRLRKKEKNIKYFIVGEHGSKTQRPHYHAIIFNLIVPDNINLAWQNGFVDVQMLRSEAGIAYTLKYIHKVERDERFTMMSKKLGEHYLTPQIIKYHKSSPKNCFVRLNGFKLPLPKYFKEKIYTESERKAVSNYLHSLFKDYHQKKIDRVQQLYGDRVDASTIIELQSGNKSFVYETPHKIANKEAILSFFAKKNNSVSSVT